jgi:DNA-dependent RNA polymerase auxiliary subunit epsilon
MKKEKKSVNNQLVTLKIDKPTHARIKKYCKENEYWMHSFVEHIMNEYLDKHKNK